MAARRDQRGERKRRLIAQARALAAERGFAGLTPAVLAEEAGLSAAQITRTFRDRPALIRALLDDLRAETFPPPDPSRGASADPAGQLLAWLKRVRKEAARPNAGFRLLMRSLIEITDTDGQAEVHARLLEWTEPIIRFLQRCQQAGVVRRSLDPQVAAWELMQAILGHALLGPRDSALAEPAPFDSLLQGVMKVDV